MPHGELRQAEAAPRTARALGEAWPDVAQRLTRAAAGECMAGCDWGSGQTAPTASPPGHVILRVISVNLTA